MFAIENNFRGGFLMKKNLYLLLIICVALIISCVSGPGPAKEVIISLHAIDAQLKTSGGLVYEDQEGRECIGWWESPNDEISWGFDVPVDGEYAVTMRVACDTQFPGSTVGVTIGGQTLTFIMPDTYDWETYFNVDIGTVPLKAGPNTVLVKGIELVNRFFGNLQEVVLKKI
jgi:hypothetical protein